MMDLELEGQALGRFCSITVMVDTMVPELESLFSRLQFELLA